MRNDCAVNASWACCVECIVQHDSTCTVLHRRGSPACKKFLVTARAGDAIRLLCGEAVNVGSVTVCVWGGARDLLDQTPPPSPGTIVRPGSLSGGSSRRSSRLAMAHSWILRCPSLGLPGEGRCHRVTRVATDPEDTRLTTSGSFQRPPRGVPHRLWGTADSTVCLVVY